MISIVCSSIEPKENYKKEILSKIGVKNAEFLFYENKGKYSLTEVYKMGIDDSINDIVLFIHDDLIMNTNNWGKKLIKHFNESDYGILGIAGTTILTKDGTWWSQQSEMVGIVNHKHQGKTYASAYSANLGNEIVKTVLVDGLFFAVHKERLKYEFDTTIGGFHMYDIDFSLGNHLNGCDVGVIFDVRVTHLSIGVTNDSWVDNKEIFIDKWSEKLPLSISGKMFYNEPVIKIKKEPKLTIIIPHIHNNELLFTCLDSLQKTNYENYNIIVADTGSTDDELNILEEYVKLQDNRISLVKYDYYNFAKINNDVVDNHVSDDTELLLFCNNDIEMINDAISIMAKYYIKNKNTVGTIGPRLHFDNGRLQHAGVMATLNTTTNYLTLTHVGFKSYYKYNSEPCKVIGNTGAFLMINKSLFNQVGKFNEGYIECFEDVQLNFEMLLKRKYNINISEAVCWHKESSTRIKNEDRDTREMTDYKDRLIPFTNKNIKILRNFFRITK